MKKSLLFGVLALALPARAQTAAVGQKIEYRPDLPKSVARLMPRGAKSLFWGRFTPKAGSAPMALHFYEVKSWNAYRPQEWIPSQYSLSALDVFVLNKGIWNRINHVRLQFHPYESIRLQKIAARLYWLNSARKAAPLIVFKTIHEESGDDIFFTFPLGLRRKSAAQALPSGRWLASTTIGEDNDLIMSKSGITQIKVHILVPDNDFPNGVSCRLLWNGRCFYPDRYDEKQIRSSYPFEGLMHDLNTWKPEFHL